LLDETGYKRKTYDELLTEMTDRTKQLFGEDTNVSERSVLGILIRIMAWFLSLVWKDNEDVYFSADLDSATGKNLDRLLPRYGVTRNLAQYATGELSITGNPDFLVEAGFLVSTSNDIFFETTEDITLDVNGEGIVPIRAGDIGGVGNVGAGLINEIVNSSSGVTSVSNPSDVTGGRERETDLEVRTRAKTSGEGLGKATVPSIRAGILELPGVRAATVIENYLDEPDQYGTPMRSFQTFVLGGIDQDIGQSIFNTKAGGIRPYGNVEVTVQDIAGTDHKVYFSRATEVTTYMQINITKNSAFPFDGESQIKSAIIQYVGGTDSSGAIYSGLNMGDDVILSKLYSIIYKVDGVDDVTITLSNDGVTYDSSNILIDTFQVAQANVNSIEVTVNV
jgi:uncharacterized phage protein gp47/JayE